MARQETKPLYRELSREAQQRWDRARQEVAGELPEMIRRASDAVREPTVSGGLRRALQSSPRGLLEIAEKVGVEPRF